MTQKLYFIIALLCALAGTAQAAATFQEGVGILGYTNGTKSAYTIGSTYTQGPQYGPINDTEVHFDGEQFNLGSNDVPITLELHGTLIFATSSSYTDVTTNDFNFTLTFTSSTNYFTGASVTTKAGAAVSGCSVSGKNSHTLTVTIPNNTTFGNIILTLATHTPLDFCTISGIEASYIDDGVNQPVPTVTVDGLTLRKDVDYTLSYTYGSTTGYVNVTGTGDYLGEKKQSFGIREPNLSDFRQLNDGAYEIASKRDLEYLARIVNGSGNNASCAGVTFRQTADIAYSKTTAWDYRASFDSNFTPIGGYGKSFNGTYDGYGHTISGIRVYTSGMDNSDSSKGLFGYISGTGTVKNVVLTDANIKGHQNIGGLVGYIDSNGSVTDCYLYHVRVEGNSNTSRSVVVGNQGGTATRTHYRDCCEYRLDGYSTKNIYKNSIFTLTPDANVALPTRTDGTVVNSSLTTYADGITLSGTQYYTKGSAVALAYNGMVPTGQWPSFTATNADNEDKTAEVIDGATLTMPAYDVAVHFDQFLPIVAYLDGNGIEQQCSNYTPITDSSGDITLGATGTTRWYVVGSDATITGMLEFIGKNVHLILCDGKTLSISNEGCGIEITGDFTIYGQQQGNGTLNVENTWISSSAIYSSRDITILGGIINATSAGGYGIQADNKTITLGWTRPANHITAFGKSLAYYCNRLQVKDGQTLWDGSGTYTDDITGSIGNLNGKTLMPCIAEATAPGGTAVLYDNDAAIIAAGGLSNAERITALADGQTRDVMLLGRTLYKDDKWNTLCLPFPMTATQVTALLGTNGTLMEMDTDGDHSGHKTGLATDGTLYLYFKEATTIEAGRPYIIKWTGGDDLVSPTFTGVTVGNSSAAPVIAANSGYQSVEFRCAYSPVTLAAGDQSCLYLGAASTLYWPSDAMTIGACRAYFHVDLTGPVNAVRAFNLGFGEGEETGISLTPDPSPKGEGSNCWYTLDGRRLDGQPTKKGVYIYNGKKRVIK